MENTKSLHGLTFAPLYTPEHIQHTVALIAQQINNHYAQIKQTTNIDLTVVCVLKGAFMFYSDLVKLIEHEHQNLFVKVKSYTGTQSSGDLTLETPLREEDIAGKHILIVEDIQDTGNTLKRLTGLFEEFKPKAIDIAVLVKRPDKKAAIEAKFWGLECS